MKQIIILGSTGSIGASTLDIIQRFPDQFSVLGLVAGKSDDKLEQQIRMFKPKIVALSDAPAAKRLRDRLDDPTVQVLEGPEGIKEVACHPESDLVISAIVGAAGLVPTLAAIQAGRRVALANKEPMVMAGQLMQEEAHRQGQPIFPIDSEHSAIFQSLVGHRREDVRRIILTASGGPFWDFTYEQMKDATLEKALKHPNWDMGAKITIDSATLMNKGLEVIEARWLFDCPPSQLDIVVHRESIIHSLVEYCDGSVMAQLGLPDMRTPISYAMNFPERVLLDPPPLNLWNYGKLTFYQPDTKRFPCLRLAYEALEGGGTLPAVLNAANEIAVDAFLNNGITFIDIAHVIEKTLDAANPQTLTSLDDALEADRWAREKAESCIHSLAS
ncbi:1-deoxy-D-xylulose-5-phosphate reductoisomerase [Candidatus Nitronereus thalassa]|uniref:1-deoxy-D-xylulose 5-phosphate reductoisomerase n=1 Tax=Candidatus Nitronereus thalassa TaxID=3020898 RepID=A0ABU3K6A2_9BACT|nr:1-deoxy-D-xylulose-5-phosphate reductoisomerase [Candidatus Nitronereus thalassa]MDT7041950.1 1-deoxy-D-xylulose-5-phosphate reductoisomerase [Candidatus Nitronereus thalassa]